MWPGVVPKGRCKGRGLGGQGGGRERWNGSRVAAEQQLYVVPPVIGHHFGGPAAEECGFSIALGGGSGGKD